jgi:hypothetical protein
LISEEDDIEEEVLLIGEGARGGIGATGVIGEVVPARVVIVRGFRNHS